MSKFKNTMADNPKDTGHPDRDLISIEQDHELAYWAGKWAVTRSDLREAGRSTSLRSVRAIHDTLVRLGRMPRKI